MMLGFVKIFATTVALVCFVEGQSVDITSYENCQALDPQIQLGWTVNRNNNTVSFLLCGCRQEDLTEQFVNQYVAFGVSGDASVVRMAGGDVTVAWIDSMTGATNAVDYFLENYIQCREGSGVCPDVEHSSQQCTDDIVLGSVWGSYHDGVQCIAFAKPFTTADSTCDLTISPDEDQYVLWAIGGIEQTAFKHFIRTEANAMPIRLGGAARNGCGNTSIICPICFPFTERTIDVRNQNASFVATIGPPGGQRGYVAIAGRAGWGYSWYINGTLIPRLIVSRGYTYTFISEGGDDPDDPGRYHPFYLTSSVTGGRLKNKGPQREGERVYAGFAEDGTPVGLGPYCEYGETAAATTALNDCGTFQEYLNGLTRDHCRSLESANLTASFTWTPDDTTPDTVYYQCATHRGFGYIITVDPPLGDTSSSTPTAILCVQLLFVLVSIAVVIHHM